MIKKITEEKKEFIYRDVAEASKTVNTKLENWKVQLFIAYAIETKTKAFKCRWLSL